MVAGDSSAPCSSPQVDVWHLKGFSSDEKTTGGGGSSSLISPTPSIAKKIVKNSGSTAC
jgi:hypothetical protein